MRRMTNNRLLVVCGLGTAFVALGVGIGMAASTVTRDTDQVRLRVIQSDFPDGFDSGWHTHPGAVIVQVTKGYLKIYQGSCNQPHVVQKGETYLEVPFVPVRGVAPAAASWTTTQIVPVADAPATNIPTPC
jgi:quercetin dioxygenase-like cupin family protein